MSAEILASFICIAAVSVVSVVVCVRMWTAPPAFRVDQETGRFTHVHEDAGIRSLSAPPASAPMARVLGCDAMRRRIPTTSRGNS